MWRWCRGCPQPESPWLRRIGRGVAGGVPQSGGQRHLQVATGLRLGQVCKEPSRVQVSIQEASEARKCQAVGDVVASSRTRGLQTLVSDAGEVPGEGSAPPETTGEWANLSPIKATTRQDRASICSGGRGGRAPARVYTATAPAGQPRRVAEMGHASSDRGIRCAYPHGRIPLPRSVAARGRRDDPRNASWLAR